VTPSDRERWNEKHGRAADAGADVGEPARWLVQHRRLLATRAPGRALDVACGRGRNARLLAELGFEVDAIDVSDVALGSLAGVPRIHPVRADLSEGAAALPHASYDVVVDFFYLERALLEPLARSLAPGGLLLFETFLRHDDMNPRFTLAPNELLHAFPALRVLAYRETDPPRPLASLVARREPGPAG